MLDSKLISLRDFILTNNPYFDTGYAKVWQDQTTGFINDGTDKIFPNDMKGNVFYLRLPNKITFDLGNRQNAISDCKKNITVVADIILVAAVRKASADVLMQNLLTSLEYWNARDVNVTGALLHSPDVIIQELSKIPKADIGAALRNYAQSDYTIVSISFKFTTPFQHYSSLTCIINPCIGC